MSQSRRSSSACVLGEASSFLGGWPVVIVKDELILARLGVRAIEHQHANVWERRERFRGALHEDHRAGVEPLTRRGREPSANAREDRPKEAAHQRGERLAARREKTDELGRWREHVPPNGDLREHSRKQMRRQVVGAPSAAARA